MIDLLLSALVVFGGITSVVQPAGGGAPTGAIVAKDSALAFTTGTATNIDCEFLSTTRFVCIWSDSTTDGFACAFDLNRTSGAISQLKSPYSGPDGFEFDAATADRMAVVPIDATNILIAWEGVGDDGFAQLFTVNAGTGEIAANGSALEFDTVAGQKLDALLYDSTHVLVAWAGSAVDGYAQILTVNTGTGTVTAEGTAHEFDTGNGESSTLAMLDSTHALVAYDGAAVDLYAKVLAIDGSYNVSSPGSSAEIHDAITVGEPKLAYLTSGSGVEYAALLWEDSVTPQSYYQSLSINTSTWAVSTYGTRVNLYGVGYADVGLIAPATDMTVLGVTGTDDDGFMKSHSFASGTGDFTELDSLETDAVAGDYHSLVDMTGEWVVMGWQNGTTGYVRSYTVDYE